MINLSDMLHDVMLNNGEISTLSNLAGHILRFEQDNGVEFADNDIRLAHGVAGEGFVDSMVQNEWDTPDCDHVWRANDETEDTGVLVTPSMSRELRVAEWEAMRPSTIRRNHIEKL